MAAAILVFACPAAAVPPPPPLPDTINAVQAIIAAMTSKDFAGYDHVLADNFVGHKAEANEVLNRESWLHEIHEAFDNKVFSVTVVNVYEGATTTDGKFRPQVMLIERVSNFGLHGGIPGDCCAYYLTETLTLENGKVIRIDRSPLFSSELSKTGERTDLQ
ncbi:hypothetical protein [Novosphingobium sp. PhB165]|uniref:hypothetical protein n=1 Tax=Novosphingobium sp. PhB165 TaxID=2485105 RepID=UPI0014050B7C|nr:hypothetical protein [Novosphingobium sp. PhB165]